MNIFIFIMVIGCLFTDSQPFRAMVSTPINLIQSHVGTLGVPFSNHSTIRISKKVREAHSTLASVWLYQ